MEANEGDASEGLSDNEYDRVSPQLSREVDETDNNSTQLDKDEDEDMAQRDDSKTVRTEASVDGSATKTKKKYNPKDPLRPRRKKARRACYACQRAHLTCDDDRPCKRCITRNLAKDCEDGVRKKAKYLHDAPVEALRPVLGPGFNAGVSSTPAPTTNGRGHLSSAGSDVSVSNVSSFYNPSAAPSYPVFSASQASTGTLADNLIFPGPQSPVSPGFVPASSNPGNPLNRMSLSSASAAMPSFSPALFDPSNPALFNFNLDGIQFGSHYAAMEFGMLGHMSSGAGDDPLDPMSISQQGGHTASGMRGFGSTADVFGNSGVNHTLFDGSSSAGGLMNDFVNFDSSVGNSFYSQGNLQHGLPHAYAIAAAPASLQSPSTDNNSPQATGYGYDGSPTTAVYNLPNMHNNGNGSNNQKPMLQQPLQQQQQQQQHKAKSAVSKVLPQSILGKRTRDPSSIYELVKEPYAYVSGFHRLLSVLRRRFPAVSIMRIAKALSSIRPSLIACTRTLNRSDLVFMEQCFQRTLFEYEDFMAQASSPTIVLRRTGEVVAVNKEFSALTGWTREVLLGKEPNLNVNTGSAPGVTSGAHSNASGLAMGGNDDGSNTGRAGLATPRMYPNHAELTKDAGPQPLFLAELMDDDNAIEFYEDFAHLAFGDSRGTANRKCRLLKYRTQDMLVSSASGSVVDEPQSAGTGAGPSSATSAPATSGTGASTTSSGTLRPVNSILSSRVARIDGEHGIARIARHGKLECSYCWHIRRDTFDIPMMIVMNNKMSSRPSIVGSDAGPEQPFPVMMEGPVISGFGRGSRELGIPTANLPVDAEATPWIADCTSGVYFGWAVLEAARPGEAAAAEAKGTLGDNSKIVSKLPAETDDKSPAVAGLYPMVMSIGFNPFYQNTKRTAEVHILYPFAHDFYGAHLRLAILGYIRPEQDYASLDALVADIQFDCVVARQSLARPGWTPVGHSTALAGVEKKHNFSEADAQPGTLEISRLLG
ncbi:Transcriptional regulator of nonfermentable carbon utilization [Sporothrix epigloea]|uniref:riboflavin kinase n=1 Tax=Sporothrix epigloea TaxID=1892477 RepID=A0ABP0DS70_9PEZI